MAISSDCKQEKKELKEELDLDDLKPTIADVWPSELCVQVQPRKLHRKQGKFRHGGPGR